MNQQQGMQKLVFFIFSSMLMATAPLIARGALVCEQEVAAVKAKAWELTAVDGFVVTDMRHFNRKKTVAGPTLCLSVDNNDIVLNGINTRTDGVQIAPVQGSIDFNGQSYVGHLIAKCTQGAVTLTHYHDGNVVPSIKQEMPTQTCGAQTVRVLLDEQSMRDGNAWHLSSAHGFKIVSDNDQEPELRAKEQKIKIQMRKGTLYINDKKQTSMRLSIMPCKGFLTWQGKHYQGSFSIAKKQDSLLLINNVPLEDYVYCVLKSESWPGWPLEVNKVLAIACRSYVLSMMQRAQSTALPYHVRSTNAHQVYAGVHKTPVLRQAVEQTRGVFLAHNQKPIIAMFDSCCGGVIPAHIKGIDFAAAPYLKRTYACNFCASSKNYRWSTDYDAHAMCQALQKEFPRLRMIKNIRVISYDRAGLAQKLSIKGRSGHVVITGQRFRSLLPKIKSLCFTVEKSGHHFQFQGSGQGHNRGLCQWGAREMVRQGYGYEEILAFYYPKTSCMKFT